MKPLPFSRGAWLLVLAAAGCSSRTQVTRISPEETVDLSGFWNDSDSRMVADALIDDALSYPWSRRHQQQNGGELPTVIFGYVVNRTAEHIAVNTFMRDLERALMQSGEARIVADAEQREQVRDERSDQQMYASPETRARLRNELGADYIVVGEISSIEDIEGNREVIFYQVDLNMTDLETNERVWIGQHKIKKYVERGRSQ